MTIKTVFPIILFLLLEAAAWAAQVRLVEDAPGSYRLQAENLQGVAGLTITLDYDPQTLRLDVVSRGPLLQKALFAANTKLLGRVKVGVVSSPPISGSGTLCTLQGQTMAGTPVRILSLQVALRDSEAQTLPVLVELPAPVNPPVPIQRPLSLVPSVTVADPVVAPDHGSGTVLPGTVVLPQPWQQEPAAPVEEPAPAEPPSLPEPATIMRPPPVAEPRLPERNKDQLDVRPLRERFCALEGERSAARLQELLAATASPLQQTPALVVSDGQTEVELLVPKGESASPGVAVSGGKLLSAGTTGENQWLVRVLPERGEGEVKVFIFDASVEMDIALALAPPLTTGAGPDLDGDGVVTCRDEYILAVNRLVLGSPLSSQGAAGGQ